MGIRLNRWVYAFVGVFVLIFAGIMYAWSVLSVPIGQEFSQVSQAALSLTFTISMALFCLGGFVGGLLSGRVDVRINVAASAVLFLVGFFVASKASDLMGLYIGYGVLVGFASGLAYNAVMGTMSRWFPDKQGLISGVLLMGFGLGSFIIGKVYQACTPADIGGWRTSFLVLGVVLFVVTALGSFFFVKPPAGYEPPSGAGARGGAKPVQAHPDMGTVQMVGRASFWLYFAWAVVVSAAGLAVIAQATGVATQVTAGSVDAGTIATAVGLISIFNGIGRVIFGGMYDRVGRAKTMMFVNVLFFVSVLVLIASVVTMSFAVLIAGFVLVGLSYGGVTPTNSAFINDYYGPRNYPVNFSIVNLNLIVASFGGTMAGVLYDMSGSYMSTFVALLVALVVATACSVAIRRP